MDAGSGTPLTSFDVGTPFRQRYGYPYVVMHRSDLLDVLLHACEAHANVTLATSKEVVSIDDLQTSARVTCADGTIYDSPIVIGADGLRSVVRPYVHDDGEPICSAYVAYRGTIPIGEMSDDTDFDNVVFWTGPDLHLMQYPVRRGELYNQVAVFKSKRYHAGATEWGTPDEMDEAFSIGNDFVRKCIAKMGRKRRWPMFDRLPIDNWTRNRIILLGDAAHPMLQYLAQGAAQALEDCVVLSDAIAAHPDDVPAAFDAFQRERAPRTGKVQTLAREWGNYWHLPEGPKKAGRDAMLRARSSQDYDQTDWFYGYRGPAGAANVTAGT
jgi:salicylate hydroxylase